MTESKPVQNPFRRVGRMHDLFVHRRPLLTRIREGLASGESLALTGPEGVGKSRLIRYFFKRYFDGKELEPHDLAVLYESPAAADDAAFLHGLHTRLRKEVSRRGFDWGEVPWVTAWEGKLEAIFVQLDALFQSLRDEGLGLVLVIEPLDEGGVASFRRALEWLAEEAKRLDMRLLTTVRKFKALPPGWRSRLTEVPVGVFTPEEALEFLTTPLTDHPAPLSRQECAELVRRTGGHPARLHKAAAEALDRRSGPGTR